MGVVWQDLRYALRGITRAPFLSFAVLLALVAGVGLNAAVFTLIDTSWLRAPVEKDPGSFVRLIPSYSGSFSLDNPFPTFSLNDYEAFRTRARSLRQVAGYNRILRVTIDDDQARHSVELVTYNFFSVYGWESFVKGRLFLPEECAAPGSAPVAVITEALWQNQYASDPNIIGRLIHINHHPYTVVGVLNVRVPTWMRADVWVPYTMQAEFWGGYDAFKHPDDPIVFVAGRLSPGYSPADAQAELRAIENQQDRLVPGRRTTLEVTNGSEIQDPNARPLGLAIIPLVMGPMMLILLVACTNVTMLLLSRAAERRGEIAIRVALGAGRSRLLRMLATEGVVIAAAAGAGGVYLAHTLPGVLWRFIIRENGYRDLGPDWKVFVYLTGVTIVAACIAGLVPARGAVKVDLLTSLKGQESTITSSSKRRNALVIAQMAMSFVLVAAGVMFARIQHSITAADPGFERRQVFVVPLNVSAPAYTPESAADFYRLVRERVSELPGVRSTSYTDTPPFFEPPAAEIRLPGEAKGQGRQAVVEQVSTDFFSTMGIHILHGRAFQGSDAASKSTSAVAIVSLTFAANFWNGQDPLGKVIVLPDNSQVRVVGVAHDVGSSNFDNPNEARLYLPQSPQAFAGQLLVRFDGDSRSLAPVITRTIRDLDKAQRVSPRTLYSLREEHAAQIRPLTDVILLLALVTVLLAVTGVYGTVVFSINQRTREIGIRTALGASRSHLLRSVLGQGFRQIVIGLAGGLLLALPAAFVFWHLVRSPRVFDWQTYAIAALVLTFVSLCAYYIPARRAMRVDPIVALRYE